MKGIDLFLSRLSNYQETVTSASFKRQFTARCPNSTAHSNGDSKSSLSVGELHNGKVLIKCFRGCLYKDIIGAAGVESKDLQGFADPADLEGVTVARLAYVKRLDKKFLTDECHLEDRKDNQGKPHVRIRYLDIAGTEVCYRNRTRVRAKDGTYHQRGKPVYPYGIWRVQGHKSAGTKVLHLVEGESNCWALWNHGQAAVGIPGGSSVKAALKAVVPDMILWADTVYVWQDPDDTGAKFVEDCAAKLAALQFSGTVLVARHATIKDPADLHAADPESFPAELAAVLAAAVPPGRRSPPPADDTPLFPAAGQPWPAGCRLDWVGLGQRFARRFRDCCRRDITSKRFVYWTGQKWEVDDEGSRARLLASQIIDSLTEEATSIQGADATSAELREEILRFRDQTRRNPRWDRPILEAVSMSDLLPVQTVDFDRDPMRLNCKNGILDLETGKLHPSNPDALFASVSGTGFDERARCPLWDSFLETVTNGNKQLIEYLQVHVGYTLTALTHEQEMYFLYGTGKNGKSSFVDTIVSLLGDYYFKIDSGLILSHKNNNSDNNILAQKALMIGKRMISTTELPQGQVFNDATIKDLADNSKILGCHKFGKPFSFFSTHKLWVFGNHKPTVRGDDEGIWRRIQLVPFSVTIPPKKRIKDISVKLGHELPGILNWALRGLKMYLDGYDIVPDVIVRDNQAYRDNNDILLEFMNQECVFKKGQSDLKVAQNTLYSHYLSWARTGGGYEIGRNSFYSRMEGKGFTRSEDDRVMTFFGIRLKMAADRPRPPVKDQKAPVAASTDNWNDM